MKRHALAACAALALAACAGTPRKSASESVALPDGGRVSRSSLPGGDRRKSPYAPAREDLSKRGHYTRGGLYAPHIKDSAPDAPLHDVDLIPEPEVVDEPRSRYGNRSPYNVLGKRYAVRDTAAGYVERGTASYYGNKFHGRRTSNLEVYDMYAFTAAHKTLPLPSFARVTNLTNGKSVVVRVNDRGPFHGGRLVDLSYAAAVKLGFRNVGTAQVEVRGLSAGENARERYQGIARSGTRRIHEATPPPRPRPLAPTSVSGMLPPGVRIATGKPTSLAANATTTTPAGVGSETGMDKLVGMLPVAAANAGGRRAAIGTRTPMVASVAPAATARAGRRGREWRFDMLQDGKAMTADEFDAWMKTRRARVATGRPGTTAASGSPPVHAATAVAAPSRTAAGSDAGRVTLQIASFSNRENAGHALAMLQQASIAGASLQDARVDGRQIWRLRIGPVDVGNAPELAARVVGLGFDQPQRVRD